MLTDELAAEVRTFEEAAASVSSSGLFAAWEKLHKSFQDAKLSATGYLRPETLRTISLLCAEFRRQKSVLAALAASRWKLTAEAFVDTSSPKALMSCEFVSQVRKLADDTTVTFAEAVEAMKRERTRRLETWGNYQMHTFSMRKPQMHPCGPNAPLSILTTFEVAVLPCLAWAAYESPVRRPLVALATTPLIPNWYLNGPTGLR